MEQFNLDHIGIAVKNLDSSLVWYQRSFGFQLESRERIETSGVEVVFLKLPNTKLELITPISAASKLNSFLEKRGEGLHHICYEVADIRAELARMTALGFELIDKTPRPGAHGSQIAFISPKSTEGVLTELCEYPKHQGN
ncbi:MAG: methylmalonyl-CoA epimerase [Oligoflexia bacterium]|nr:methylmalonyl-CoA epimerase [Oligoflexia bacterium]